MRHRPGQQGISDIFDGQVQGQHHEADLFFEELTGQRVYNPNDPRAFYDAADAGLRPRRVQRSEADLFFEALTGEPALIVDHVWEIDVDPSMALARRGTFRHATLGHRGHNVEARWNFDAATGRRTPRIDIVVHLHGYGRRTPGFLARKARMAGLDMVDSNGSVIVRPTRPTLALVPLGNYRPFYRYNENKEKTRIQRWSFDKLQTKTDFDALVVAAQQWLASVVLGLPSGSNLARERLILMAHSGGGAGMNRLLDAGLDPDEVVCYDSTYGAADPIIRWARRKIAGTSARSGALRVFHRGGKPANAARQIKRAVDRTLTAQGANCTTLARRYRVERTRVGHSDIPSAYTKLLLNDMTAVMPRTTAGRSPCTTATSQRRAEALPVNSAPAIDYGETAYPAELTPTQIVDRIRDMALETARARRTFLSEAEVRSAIDSRTSGDPVDLHMDQSVAHVQASGSIPFIGSLIEQGALWLRTMNLLVLLERQKFKCSSTGTLSLDMAVVDAMRDTWTAANEGQTVAGLCGSVPTPCPTTHQSLHGTGNAAHFTRLSQLGIRVVELAGLWGKNLIGVSPQSHRARIAVKALPTSAPAANVSFVAVRSNRTRHVHVGNETPRRVEALVGTDTWKNLAIEATPGTDFQVFKRRYWEASFHRQWGKEATIQWVKGLAQFYHDRTGSVLGVGDISHIVGEDMTDHNSHERGVDIDLYGLEAAPAGTVFPTAFWTTVVSGTVTFKPLGMPAAGSTAPLYTVPAASTPALAGTAASRVQRLYVTILAYCAATHGQLNAAVWHGARRLRTDAVTEAQAAWDATVAAGLGSTARPGWQSNWGPGPANRAAISATAAKFIGDGSANYGASASWPPHHDHVHVRLS